MPDRLAPIPQVSSMPIPPGAPIELASPLSSGTARSIFSPTASISRPGWAWPRAAAEKRSATSTIDSRTPRLLRARLFFRRSLLLRFSIFRGQGDADDFFVVAGVDGFVG